MAGSVILTSLSQLQEQRKGFIQISITNFDLSDTTAPEIALGSRLEHGGTVIQFTANEAISGFAGLGAGVCYAYIDGSAYTAAWTATAPVWDTEKQGYYSADGSKRYFLRCVKDAGGNYTQKALYTNVRQMLQTYTGLALNPLANGDQEIRFATDASILWDESEDQIVFNKGIDCNYKIASGGAGTELATFTGSGFGPGFYIKKPIAVYIHTSNTAQYAHGDLQICQNSVWTSILVATPYGGSEYAYGGILVPGYYRLFSYAGSSTVKLYCTGVYGSIGIVVAEIIG